MMLSLLILPGLAEAQRLSVEAGIYDYTGDVAREFYLLSPTILAGYDFLVIHKLRFNVSGGIGYRQFKYQEDKHHLLTVPLFLSACYDFGNGDAKVYPSAGMGFSALYKSDRNLALDEPHRSFTYGYHISGMVNLRLSRVTWYLRLRYNFLLPPAMDEVRMSGIMLMIGVRIPTTKL